MRKLIPVLLIALLGADIAVAQLPHPALLALNKDANELAIVDPASLKVVGRIPVGAAPHEVAVSADGKLAFVANYGAQQPGNSISVIDLAAQKEIKHLELGALRRPHGIVEAGGKIWFTAEQNRAIARLDPATLNIEWLMGTGQTGTHMMLLTPDQKKIFTANIGSNSVTEFEYAGNGAAAASEPQGWRITQISVGKGPEGIAMSPDGSEVWAAHSEDGGISIIDVASGAVKQVIPGLTKRSNRVKFTPDGKLALVSDVNTGDVLVLDAAKRGVVKTIHLGGQPEGILITPDGARAFVATGEAGNKIAVIDLESLAVSGEFQPGPDPDGMAWVP